MQKTSNNLTNTPPTGRSPRRGSAPLELVMVTPILVAVFVLIIWVGNFMIGQAYVTTDARNQAWHKRFTEARSTEYEFQGDQGVVDADSTQERRISALVSAFPNPRSRHMVIGDAWHARLDDSLPAAQQRARELNSHWNSRLQLELGKLAGINTVNDVVSDILGLQNIGDRIEELILQAIASQLGPLESLFDQFKSGGDDLQEDLEKKKAEEREKLRNRIEQLDAEIARLKGEIQAKQDRITAIDDAIEASENAGDGDDEKLTDEEIDDLKKERKKIVDEDIPALKAELARYEEEKRLKSSLLNQL